DLLLCTKMSAFEIIIGKLISSLAFILLLIISSIPLFSLVFLFGGITPGDIVTLFFFYIIIAMVVGSISIFFSPIFKRTMVATVVTYGTIFAWYILTLIIAVFLLSRHFMDPSASQEYIPTILYFNPLFGLGDIIARQLGGSMQNAFRDIFGLRGNVPGQTGGFNISPWMINSVIMAVITGIMMAISSFRVKPVRTRMKARKKKK